MIGDESSLRRTIYVGNISTIPDDELREYFQNFTTVDDLYHDCSTPADLWLVDYRFIRFLSETNINTFLNNTLDHTIGRIRLDIHSYNAAVSHQTRLVSDRKICIAHTNPMLNRNLVKKAFTRYGKIVNCNCMSSGNGIEYVYIEFESVNSVQLILNRKNSHFAGKTSLAVRKAIRPSQFQIKIEPNVRQEFGVHFSVDKAQYSSSFESKNRNELQRVTNCSATSTTDDNQCSQQQLKEFECQYEMIIRKDFDEITYQIEKFRSNQENVYRKLKKFIAKRTRSESNSSSEDGEIDDELISISSSDDESKRRKIFH